MALLKGYLVVDIHSVVIFSSPLKEKTQIKKRVVAIILISK
jgi:hypothetical protein